MARRVNMSANTQTPSGGGQRGRRLERPERSWEAQARVAIDWVLSAADEAMDRRIASTAKPSTTTRPRPVARSLEESPDGGSDPRPDAAEVSEAEPEAADSPAEAPIGSPNSRAGRRPYFVNWWRRLRARFDKWWRARRRRFDACVEVADLGRDERWPAYRNVCRQLALAESYRTQRATLVTWWRGTRVQGTWAHIQNAKVGLIDVLDTDQVVGYSARVRSLVERYLEEGDPERIAVNALFERLDRRSSQVIALTGSVDRLSMVRGKLTFTGSLESSEAKEPARPDIGLRDRAALAAALQAAYERTAAEYQRLRRFESLVIGSAVAVLVLVGILALVGWREPSVVPLCFPDPGEQVAEPEGQSDRRGTVCATQDAPPPVASDTSANGTQSEQQPEPSAGDVPTVALFGLIGASLTSVSFVVRKAPRTSVPIGTSRIFQVVLKAATGMLTAVVGLLFLRAGVVPGFTRIDTRSQILVYAVIFGAAQHLVTTFIDRRSNELVEAVTSIETEETPGVSASPPGR